MPTVPGRWMCAGMMPIFTLPRADDAGAVRADEADVSGDRARNAFTRIMSLTGIPSVIATTSATPASAASMIASAADGGGTKISEALRPRLLDRLGDRVEDRDPLDVGAALAGGHAADDLRAVVAPGEARGTSPRGR